MTCGLPRAMYRTVHSTIVLRRAGDACVLDASDAQAGVPVIDMFYQTRYAMFFRRSAAIDIRVV
ncbi:hypothetical protein I010019E5_15770 [Bifidobacterium adolescentis]